MIFMLFFSELVSLANNVDAPNAVTVRHETMYISIAVEMVEFLRWERTNSKINFYQSRSIQSNSRILAKKEETHLILWIETSFLSVITSRSFQWLGSGEWFQPVSMLNKMVRARKWEEIVEWVKMRVGRPFFLFKYDYQRKTFELVKSAMKFHSFYFFHFAFRLVRVKRV